MTTSFQTRTNQAPEESIKSPCVASTPSNITLSGEQTIAGVAVVAGNRVLVRSQTDPIENGIYDASTSAWARSTDWNDPTDVINGMLVADANSTNDVIYKAEFTGDFSPGVTSVTFSETVSSGLITYTGAAGIQAEYNERGQYLVNYMDDLIGVNLASFVVGETVICNAINSGSAGTYSTWEKLSDDATPPDAVGGINTDGFWYSAASSATKFKEVRQGTGFVKLNKTAAVLFPPISGMTMTVESSDGGLFKAKTGAAASTYSDDGGLYCGTQFIPTGGDGSAAWVRDFDGIVDPVMFGAQGTGLADDDKVAFQLWASYLNANSAKGIVPKPTSFYNITEPFMLLSDLDVDFGEAEIRNTANDVVNYWNNTVCFLGTYFGQTDNHFADDDKDPTVLSGVSAIYEQPFLRNPYDLDDIAIGDNTVTLQTPADASDFTAGDVVMIRDPHHTLGDSLVTVSSITRSGTTVTVTTTGSHGFTSGYILVQGSIPAEYNGYWLITGTTSTTFTYEIVATPTTPASVVGSCYDCSIPYSISEHLNEVIDISGAVLTLKYPVKDAYTTSVGAGQSPETTGPVALYRESGLLALTTVTGAQTVPQAGSGVCTLAKRSKIRNVNFWQDVDTYGQAFHIACYECDLENISINGASVFGINPCAYTNFKNVRTSHRANGFEMAYCHNDVLVDGITQTRIGDYTSTVGNIAFSETGHDVLFKNFNINGYTGGDAGIAALSASTKRVHFEDGIVNGSDGAGVTFGADGKSTDGSIKNVEIKSHDTDGIQINSQGIEVHNNKILGTSTSQEAIQLASFITSGKITDNICGEDGARTSGDIIYAPGGRQSGLKIKGNQTFNTREHELDNTQIEHTGTLVLTTIKTLTIPQNTTPQKEFAIRVRASGNVTPTSTNGTKDIDITVGGTNVGTLAYLAVDTGLWEFDCLITKESNTSANVFNKAFAETLTKGDNKYTLITSNWSSTDIDIDIDVTLGNTSDAVRIRSFEVEYVGAEYNVVT